GVEWRADFMADLGKEIGFRRRRLLGAALGFDELLLRALPLGKVAQHRAEFFAVLADPAERHEQRDEPALTHPPDPLAAAVDPARHPAPRKPVEISLRGAAAFWREEFDERPPAQFLRLVAEQRLGAAAELSDASVLRDHDDAVGGGIDDRFELADLGF